MSPPYFFTSKHVTLLRHTVTSRCSLRIPQSSLIELTENDKQKAKGLLSRPYMCAEPDWKHQVSISHLITSVLKFWICSKELVWLMFRLNCCWGWRRKRRFNVCRPFPHRTSSMCIFRTRSNMADGSESKSHDFTLPVPLTQWCPPHVKRSVFF